MKWEMVYIKEIGKVITGKTPSTKERKYYDGDYLFISPKDLRFDSRYIKETNVKITEAAIEKFRNQVVNKNSIFFTSLSFGFGKIGIANEKCLTNQQIHSIVVDESKYDFNFIYYLIKHSTSLIRSYDAGIVTPIVPKKVFEKIRLNVPKNITVQEKIGKLLSSYDDLIENNLKRIKLLEQAAQNIYKEWFVNMRFPGYEEAKFDSETGLPEGWEEKGICDFKSFKQYKTKIQPFNGEKEYLATANINGIAIQERGDSFTFENKPSRAQIQPPLNSVWFARMSNTDKVLLVTEKANNDFMISSGFAGFKAEKKEALPFLFCLINNSNFSKLKDANATGSTQVSLNNNSLKSIKVIEPTFDMIEKFGALNYDSLELIQHLFKANEKLKQARDILLPRLMNQTIEV